RDDFALFAGSRQVGEELAVFFLSRVLCLEVLAACAELGFQFAELLDLLRIRFEGQTAVWLGWRGRCGWRLRPEKHESAGSQPEHDDEQYSVGELGTSSSHRGRAETGSKGSHRCAVCYFALSL